MGKTQLDKDAQSLGLAIANGMIHAKGYPPGVLAGATVQVEQSTGEPSRFARLTTSFGQRGQMHGKARIFVTIRCTNGVTIIVEREPKHEMAARRFAAQVAAVGGPAA